MLFVLLKYQGKAVLSTQNLPYSVHFFLNGIFCSASGIADNWHYRQSTPTEDSLTVIVQTILPLARTLCGPFFATPIRLCPPDYQMAYN